MEFKWCKVNMSCVFEAIVSIVWNTSHWRLTGAGQTEKVLSQHTTYSSDGLLFDTCKNLFMPPAALIQSWLYVVHVTDVLDGLSLGLSCFVFHLMLSILWLVSNQSGFVARSKGCISVSKKHLTCRSSFWDPKQQAYLVFRGFLHSWNARRTQAVASSSSSPI